VPFVCLHLCALTHQTCRPTSPPPSSREVRGQCISSSCKTPSLTTKTSRLWCVLTFFSLSRSCLWHHYCSAS
jgi:hypothetical protein